MKESFGAALLLAVAVVILLGAGQAAAQDNPRKFDEYGKLKPADEDARLDNFAIQLQTEPGSQGYVITYGGKTSAEGAAQSSADKAKFYLVDTRGLIADRIVTVDGGFRDKPFTELWIVPSGVTPPKASPTLDPSKVTPPKTTKKRRTRRTH
jgi:hypothetical protein